LAELIRTVFQVKWTCGEILLTKKGRLKGEYNMRVQKKIVITALPEMIWPFLVDPEKILQWCFTLESFQYTSGQKRGKDATFRYVEKGEVHRLEVNCVITEWIEHRRISFQLTEGAHFKSYVERWEIAPAGKRSTFNFDQEIKMPYGIIGDLIGIYRTKRAAKVVEEMLAKLKESVEN
jgi:uncharacterized protein YndB with AHSA1/START domain